MLSGNHIQKLSIPDDELFKLLVHPGSETIFFDPVNVSCGHTLEKVLAEEITTTGNGCCPHSDCNEAIKVMLPNLAVKQMAELFITQHPSYTQKQFFSEAYLIKLIKTDQTDKVISILHNHPHKLNLPLTPIFTRLKNATINP